ncbi:MAG: branched-chain amino acid ABC transporter permease [Burkholderiaceae bacterium]
MANTTTSIENGKFDWAALLGSLAIFALLAIGPFFIYPVFLMKLMCYALFAATFNLVFGYAGLMSFGHAALWGAGAYMVAQSSKFWGFGPVEALFAGMAIAGVLGAIIGWLAIRRKGIEFGMITLALAELFAFLMLQMPFTNGEDGIQGVPRGVAFGVFDLAEPANIYVYVMVVFAIGMFALWRTVHSPFGAILRAIRDHENRAVSLGYDVGRFKLIAFVISAVIAGLAGGTKALVFQYAVLDDVSFHLSGQVVMMVLLGGLGRFFGPFVGAAIMIALDSFLAESAFPAPVIAGVAFVLCVLLFRRGVVGEIGERLRS